MCDVGGGGGGEGKIGMDQKVGLGMEVAVHIGLQKAAMEMSGIDQREVLGLHLNLDHMVQTHLLERYREVAVSSREERRPCFLVSSGLLQNVSNL